MFFPLISLFVAQVFAGTPSCGSNHYTVKQVAQGTPYQPAIRNSQMLDIYIPEAAPGAPAPTKPYKTIMLFHGGCFQIGGRAEEDTKDYINKLVAAGYAVVSVDYRLAKPNPDDPSKSINKYPAQLDDARDAWCWVQDVGAKQYGLDNEKMVPMGFSAGGTIAGWIGTNHTAGTSHRPSCTPKVGGTSVYFGRTNFLKSTEPVPKSNPYGMDCGEALAGERRNNADPQQIFKDIDIDSHIDPSTTAPVYDAHGNDDHYVNYSQGKEFCDDLKGKCELNTIEKAEHGFPKPEDMDKADDGLCKFLSAKVFTNSPTQMATVNPTVGAGAVSGANH